MKTILLSTAFILFFSLQLFAQTEWIVPEKNVYSVNPTLETEFLLLGKGLYEKYCQSCHGVEGHGDGKTLDKLDVEVCDFSIAKFQSQPDGIIYYKITFGRSNMPNHAMKLPDDIDRWLLVNYIRTLAENNSIKKKYTETLH